MEKIHLERRIKQMEAEGTRFRAGVEIGKDISWQELKSRFDSVLVATGATKPRDLKVDGRELVGVHFAMEYLTQANKAVAGDSVVNQISAKGKHVVILGGGDTGADCLGTATRQGAASVTTLAIGAQPTSERRADQPWPTFPTLFEVASAHEEFGERKYLASTVAFEGKDGQVTGIKVAETEFVDGKRRPKQGTEQVIQADLVLLALGFTGVESDTLEQQVQANLDFRGNINRDDRWETNIPGMFVAGDAGRGQSLIVWAIAEGRAAAAAIDAHLEGSTELPAPVKPTDQPISVYS
jgi:glutamate synthase (NADPH/NADH) small chain